MQFMQEKSTMAALLHSQGCKRSSQRAKAQEGKSLSTALAHWKLDHIF
jgi:hypothetical protein